MCTETCEYCGKQEWLYKSFHTPDGKWLCNECSMTMRDLAKSAILTYDEYVKVMNKYKTYSQTKEAYLLALRNEVINAYGKGKPPESFIRQKVSEYVNVEIQYTERFLKKRRLTITDEEYYNMIMSFLSDYNYKSDKISLIQSTKFLDFYNREVNRSERNI